MSQGGMVSIFQDFPMSPDMVSEVKVLTSNYAPEYGSSTSGQIMAVTKSGGSSFHGAGFEFHRDDSLKATQWGASEKPEFKRNNYGANLGGPAKLPGLWSDGVKSYFYFNYEGYRQTGGSNQPTLSIPSVRERAGDFTRLARRQRQPDPDLRPADDPSDGRGGYHQEISSWAATAILAERDLPESHQPAHPAVARGTADTDRRRPVEQLPRSGDPRHDPRQLRLLHGPVRRADGEQRSHLHERLASARAGEVRVGAAAADRQRDLLRSAELLGQPAQLGSHLQQLAAEPHVDGIPEPQRGLRVGEPELRRRLPQDRRRGRLQRSAADDLQRRVRAVRAATPASTSATSRRGRRSSSTTR